MGIKVYLALTLPEQSKTVYYKITITNNNFTEDYVLYKINRAIDLHTIQNVSELIEYINVTFGKNSMVSCINKKMLEKKIA